MLGGAVVEIDGPYTWWEITMLTMRVSVASKAENIAFDVRVSYEGKLYDPRSATFEVASMDSFATPADADWKTGRWNITTLGTYQGLLSVGPQGDVTLPQGDYYTWVRITDPYLGQEPARQVGQLMVR